MRSRSRTSASPAFDLRRRALGGEHFQHGVQRRLRILQHQQPRGAERHDAVADLRADRAAAAGDHDGLALHEAFQPLVVDLDARPQQQILDRDRREPQRLPLASRLLERRQPARGRPSRRASIRIASGAASGSSAVGVSTSRVDAACRAPAVRTTRSRSSQHAEHRDAADAWPWSAGEGDRTPTGQIFLTAPLSIARSSTSASAARPRTRVGAGIARRAAGACACSGNSDRRCAARRGTASGGTSRARS